MALEQSAARTRGTWMTEGLGFFSTLFSFEFLFAFFLFGSRFKTVPILSWIPVDLTALLFGSSVVVGFFLLWRRRFRARLPSFWLVLLTICLAVLAVASMAWSPSRAYARQKAFYVATLVLWSLVACALIIAPERQRLRRFAVSALVFAFFAAGEGAVASFQAGGFQHVVKGIGGNYLGMQRVIGPGMLILLAYVLFTPRERVSRKLGALIVLAFMGFTMLTLGGRGPVVATALAALVPFFVGIRLRPTPFLGRVTMRRYVVPLIMLAIVAFAAVALLIAAGFSSSTLSRFSELVQSGSLDLTNRRFELYADALVFWQQSPLVGRGIGAFPILEGWLDQKGYPHNLIFETLAELGLVGVVLLGAINLVALRALGSLRSIRSDPWRILILMLFVNAFLNAMLTEDIAGNRLVFAILGLMVMARQEVRVLSPASVQQHG